MNPTDTPVVNAVFSAPEDLDESQVHPIRGFRFDVKTGNLDGSHAFVVAWKPDQQDIDAINRGDPIFLSCIGGLVPHFLTTQFTAATMGVQPNPPITYMRNTDGSGWDKFNPFTAMLRDTCRTHGSCLCRMRNGSLIPVYFDFSEEDGGFHSHDYSRAWANNGRSLAMSDFDLIEFNPAHPDATPIKP